MKSFVGFGFDVHRLSGGRKLVLGGVNIPFEVGLAGHSDADVLIHAAADAILGAASLGDLGEHFPDSEPRYRDISSISILKAVRELAAGKGLSVTNIDCTLVMEKPRISEYRELMREKMAEALGINKTRLSIKATTSEGLGFTGRGEGIAAYAVCNLAGRAKPAERRERDV